jgi:hypothetical protein
MINALTQQPIKDSELKSLSDLALRQLDLEQEIEARQEVLDKLNAELQQLGTLTIPDKMKELGLSEFKLANGWKVAVNPFYSASIIKERSPDAIAWLEKNDMGGVVKREINVPIEKGDAKSTKKIEASLKKLGIEFEKKESVHSMTLKSLFRELSEKGKTLPSEFFKTFVGNITKITATK